MDVYNVNSYYLFWQMLDRSNCDFFRFFFLFYLYQHLKCEHSCEDIVEIAKNLHKEKEGIFERMAPTSALTQESF